MPPTAKWEALETLVLESLLSSRLVRAAPTIRSGTGHTSSGWQLAWATTIFLPSCVRPGARLLEPSLVRRSSLLSTPKSYTPSLKLFRTLSITTVYSIHTFASSSPTSNRQDGCRRFLRT